jgi:hypothetical protein
MKLEELHAALSKTDTPNRFLDRHIWFHRLCPREHLRGEPWKYTTSIDDALTLLPAEPYWVQPWTYLLTRPAYDNGKLIGAAKFVLHHPLSSGGGPSWQGVATTPALAICVCRIEYEFWRLEHERRPSPDGTSTEAGRAEDHGGGEGEQDKTG